MMNRTAHFPSIIYNLVMNDKALGGSIELSGVYVKPQPQRVTLVSDIIISSSLHGSHPHVQSVLF